MDDIFGLALCERHVEGVDDEPGLEIMTHRPADDPPREGFQNHSEIEEAGTGRHVSDVVRAALEPMARRRSPQSRFCSSA